MTDSLLPAREIPATMQALVATEAGPVLATAWPVRMPQPHEALLRIRLVGICSTDLQILAGYRSGFRGVLGHEFVGEVVAAPGAGDWIGRRVVGEINIGCGSCELCLRGLSRHCLRREALGIVRHDGALAEYLNIPVANLYAVPGTLSDAEAVFTEPLAAALEILEQVHIAPSMHVCVLGDGRLGLLIAQVLATTACDLTVIGRNAHKLAILERRGIRTVLVGRDAVLAAHHADVVVEATGGPQGFAEARRLVRPRGVLVLKSTFAALQEFDISALVVDEVTLVGSRCGPFAPALELLERRRIDTESLISARYSLRDSVQAIARAGEQGVIKVLVAP